MFVEYIDQPEMVRHRDGSITAARFFKVWDATPATIIGDPTLIVNPGGGKLPTYGELHPSIGAIDDTAPPVLTYYTVSQQGAMLLATAYYTNDQEATGFALTFQRQAVQVPILKRVSVTQPGASPSRVYWSPDSLEMFIAIGRLMKIRHFARKSFAGGDVGQLQESIVSRIGDLHVITSGPAITPGGEVAPPADPDADPPSNPQPGPDPQPDPTLQGTYYRFEGADVEIVNGAWVRAIYSWSYDPGVKVNDEDDGIIFPLRESLLYSGRYFAVPPYQWVQHAARRDAQPTDENQWTFATGVQDYRRGRELDWQGLPGMGP